MSEVKPLSRPKMAVGPYCVLAFTVLVAVLGVLPYQLMFLFPLAASLTLSGIHRKARIVIASLSAGMLVLGALMTLG